jgi:HPr kinase/phosphorylase
MQNISNPGFPQRVSPARIQLHGVLVRVLDTGVLLIGESGIGKSECALELVTKGHQLVADDVVEVTVATDSLSGKAPALTFELLEIRGLGIINVRELFGQFAACSESEIDLCIELRKWSEVDRIENVVKKHEVGGYVIPKFILPVSSGRSLSTLVEVAARLFRNRETGSDAARVLLEKHEALLNPMR